MRHSLVYTTQKIDAMKLVVASRGEYAVTQFRDRVEITGATGFAVTQIGDAFELHTSPGEPTLWRQSGATLQALVLSGADETSVRLYNRTFLVRHILSGEKTIVLHAYEKATLCFVRGQQVCIRSVNCEITQAGLVWLAVEHETDAHK